jgi:long-chain acyl-CoA synthetase
MQIMKGHPYFKIRSFATLREMLWQSVDLYQEKVAFRYREQPGGDLLVKTYGEFKREIQNLGTALQALGLKDCRLAVVGENSYAWCLAHATMVCGAGVAVPLDRMLPAEEIISLLDRGNVDVVFYDPSFHAALMTAAAAQPRLRALICLRPSRFGREPEPAWDKPAHQLLAQDNPDEENPTCKLLVLDDLVKWGAQLRATGDESFDRVAIDPGALMALLYTSGTTSISKAVMLSNTNVCSDAKAVGGVVRLWPGIRVLSVLPLHHTFENTCGLYMCLYYGAEIHECDGLRYIQKNMQEFHIEMLIGVPVLFENFYNKVQETLKKTGKDTLVNRMIPITNGLRKIGLDLRRKVYKQILDAFGGALKIGICGAAPINPEIISFFDNVGFHILQGYGLTETSPVIAGCNSKVFVPGTVGHPLDLVEIAINSDVDGEPGEILVRGPMVMLGYYQDPAATAEVIDANGWFHTGDIGKIDPKNHCLAITGRQKSMIVLSSGKKVFPEEIEYLLTQADFVKESLVWGEPDNDGELVISAKMVIDKDSLSQQHGQEVDEETIRQHIEQLIKDINSRLPTFKGIRNYVFSFQEMVKTTSLKVRRPIEIAKIRDWMAHQKLRLRDITGRNVDQDNPSHNGQDGSKPNSSKQNGGKPSGPPQ